MITITMNNDFTLNCDTNIIPAQHSANTPFKFEVPEEYQNSLVIPGYMYYDGCRKVESAIDNYSNGNFTLPANAFSKEGMLAISFAITTGEETITTTTAEFEVRGSVNTSFSLPDETVWQNMLQNFMEQYMTKVYSSIIEDLIQKEQDHYQHTEELQIKVNDLIKKAEQQQSNVTQLIDNVNAKIENGDFIPNLQIGTVENGSQASATFTGSKENPELNLVLPKGEKGDSNALTIGNVTSGDAAEAYITGEVPNQVLNLVLPKGEKGDKGDKGDNGVVGSTKENMVINSNFNDWICQKKENNTWMVDDGTLEDPVVADLWYRTPNMNTIVSYGRRYFYPSQSVTHTDIASINQVFPSTTITELVNSNRSVTLACYVYSIAKKEDDTPYTWKMCLSGHNSYPDKIRIFDDVNNIIQNEFVVLHEGLNILTIDKLEYPSYQRIGFALFTEDIEYENNKISIDWVKMNRDSYDGYVINPHKVELALCMDWYFKISNPAYSWATKNDKFHIGCGEYYSNVFHCTVPIPSDMKGWGSDVTVKCSSTSVRDGAGILFHSDVTNFGINNGIASLGFTLASGNLNVNDIYVLTLLNGGYIEFEKDVFSS